MLSSPTTAVQHDCSTCAVKRALSCSNSYITYYRDNPTSPTQAQSSYILYYRDNPIVQPAPQPQNKNNHERSTFPSPSQSYIKYYRDNLTSPTPAQSPYIEYYQDNPIIRSTSQPYTKAYPDDPSFQTSTQSYIKYYRDNPNFQTSSQPYIRYYHDNLILKVPTPVPETHKPLEQMPQPSNQYQPTQPPPQNPPFTTTPHNPHHPPSFPPGPTPSPSTHNNLPTPPWSLSSSPVQILHTFNLLHSLPAQLPTHPMVLELQQTPLPPQIQLEHELRVIALQGWWERHGNQQSPETMLSRRMGTQRMEELAERREWEVKQKEAEKKMQGIGAKEWAAAGGEGEGGGWPRLEGQPVGVHNRADDPMVGTMAKRRRWEELRRSMSGSNDGVVGGPLPGTSLEVGEGRGEEFEAGPWGEIGRSWARVKDWERE